MTFDALKPTSETSAPTYDPAAIKTALIAGIKAGTVKDCHSAVEAANLVTGPKLSGNEVCGIYEALLAEVRQMDAEADKLATEGKVQADIQTALTGLELSFSATDILQFKAEVYGSVADWLVAMTGSEV